METAAESNQLLSQSDTQPAVDPTLYRRLRPTSMDIVIDNMCGGGAELQPTRAGAVRASPPVPMDAFLDAARTRRFVLSYVESTLGDACTVGRIMEYKLGVNISQDIALIRAILRAGLSYVTTSGRGLLVLLGHRRAALPLKGQVPIMNTVVKKVKDVRRVLRNVAPNSGKLSLRVNTNVPMAISKLHLHHEHRSWITPELEAIWVELAALGELLVFEMWHGGDMVAADFIHVAGPAVYVATRFFDTAMPRKLQLGYVMAFTIARVLQQKGCSWLDYGGTDSSVLMSYKHRIANVVPAPQYLHDFWWRLDSKSSSWDSSSLAFGGIISENLSDTDLISFDT